MSQSWPETRRVVWLGDCMTASYGGLPVPTSGVRPIFRARAAPAAGVTSVPDDRAASSSGRSGSAPATRNQRASQRDPGRDLLCHRLGHRGPRQHQSASARTARLVTGDDRQPHAPSRPAGARRSCPERVAQANALRTTARDARALRLANCATSESGWQTPAFTLPRGVREASAFSPKGKRGERSGEDLAPPCELVVEPRHDSSRLGVWPVQRAIRDLDCERVRPPGAARRHSLVPDGPSNDVSANTGGDGAHDSPLARLAAGSL